MKVEINHQEAKPAPVAAKKLFIKSYGCQMNVYDAVRMQDLLAPHGYTPADTVNNADLVIMNTCHIREKADDKLFSDVGRFRRAAPKAILAVGGCVGQAMGAKVMENAPAVKVVFGPQTFHRLPEFIAHVERAKAKGLKGKAQRVVDTEFPELEKFDALPPQGATGPTAFVSIQEGCNKFCTYCVVPYTRGEELSRPLVDIEKDVQGLVQQGVREVTLIGQNVNAYHGEDELGNEISLAGLMARLAKIEGLLRIRFTTSHPNNMTADLIEIMANEPKVMPYLHLPVQAGSNKILQAMNRNHTAESYLETIAAVRAARPDVAISGDFIVGFPGETEEDYLHTLAVAAEVGYSSAYSFAYSQRPGTPADAMPNQVDETTKKERLAGLQALLNDQQAAFNAQFLGQVVDVLVTEEGDAEGQMRGRSPHNVAVNFEGHRRLVGHVVPVKITEARPRSLVGEVVLADG